MKFTKYKQFKQNKIFENLIFLFQKFKYYIKIFDNIFYSLQLIKKCLMNNIIVE